MIRTWTLVALVLFCGASSFAQVISGSLEGVVRDQQGSVIQGSRVTIVQQTTNRTRSVATNSQGTFRFEQLDIGPYRLLVEKPGFKKLETTVQVEPGNAASINAQLDLGEVSETIVVQSDLAPIQTETSEIAREIPASRITQLPVLDRDPTELLQLEPGIPAVVANKNGAYTVGGLGPRSTTYNVDGSSNNFDVSSGQITPIIMEAVASVHAVTAVFSPQYGKGSGAVVDILLHSGGNSFHGGLFEYNRNTVLNANPYFANAAGLSRAPYNENVYGGTIGGPIRKDKLFFFGAFEGDNLSQAAIQTLTLPSNSYRTLDTTGAGTQANDPVVAATINAVFARMPSCPGTAEACVYTSEQPAVTNQYLSTLKIDYNINSSNQLSGRFLGRNANAVQNTALANLNTTQTTTDYNSAVAYHHIFNSHMVNEFIATGAGYIVDTKLPVTNIPDVGISGYSGIGGSSNLPQAFTNQNLEFEDNFSWTPGKHSFRFGEDIMRTSTVGEADFNSRGVYSVTALPAPYGTSDPLTNLRRGLAQTFVQDTGDFARRFSNWYVGFYAQDDWKLRSNFTLNLGVRFQQQLSPTVSASTNGQVAYEAFDSDAFKFGHIPNNDLGVSPFIGFAWDPHHNGSMSLRGGYRRAYDALVLDYYDIGAILQPPFIKALGVALPQVPVVPVGNATSIAQAAGLPISLMLNANNIKLPYADSWQLSVQQRILRGASLEVSYLGTAGRNLPYAVVSNRVNPTTHLRANTSFGALSLVNSIGYSNYNGLLTKFVYSLSSTLHITTAYTWSKAADVAVDPAATFGTEASVGAQENFAGTQTPNTAREYAPSVFDRPHAFSASVVYRTPNWIHSSLGGALLNGWNASAIVLAQTGIPFTVFSGADLNQDGTNNDRPDIVDPTILGTHYTNPSQVIPKAAFNGAASPVRTGNLGRNAFRQDGITNTDLSFAKSFPVHKEANVEIRSEFFNLFNHPQFGTPTSTLTSGTFGHILTQQNSSRQIRLGARLQF